MTRFGKRAPLAGGVLALLVAGWLSWSRARAPLGLEPEWRSVSPMGTPELAPTPYGDRAPPGPAPEGRMMRGVVRAQEVDAWTLRFTAGQTARIWIDGDRGTDLDCVVQDAAGNLLDVDADERGRCHLRWVPARTGSYRIMVRNPGSAAVSYQLVAH